MCQEPTVRGIMYAIQYYHSVTLHEVGFNWDMIQIAVYTRT